MKMQKTTILRRRNISRKNEQKNNPTLEIPKNSTKATTTAKFIKEDRNLLTELQKVTSLWRDNCWFTLKNPGIYQFTYMINKKHENPFFEKIRNQIRKLFRFKLVL